MAKKKTVVVMKKKGAKSPDTRTTEQRKLDFVTAIQRGLSLREACVEARVSIGSVSAWRHADKAFDLILSSRPTAAKPIAHDPEAVASGMEMLKKAAEVRAALQAELPTEAVRAQPRMAPYTPSAKIEEKVKQIVHDLERGLDFWHACCQAGVRYTEVEQWCRQDEGIRNRINAAEGLLQKYLLGKILKAADKNWKAAAWLLERRFPGSWGQTKTINLQAGAPKGIVPDSKASLSDPAGIDAKLKTLPDADLKSLAAAAMRGEVIDISEEEDE